MFINCNLHHSHLICSCLWCCYYWMQEISKYGVQEISSFAKISQLVKAKEMSLLGHVLNTFCFSRNYFQHLPLNMEGKPLVLVTRILTCYCRGWWAVDELDCCCSSDCPVPQHLCETINDLFRFWNQACYYCRKRMFLFTVFLWPHFFVLMWGFYEYI